MTAVSLMCREPLRPLVPFMMLPHWDTVSTGGNSGRPCADNQEFAISTRVSVTSTPASSHKVPYQSAIEITPSNVVPRDSDGMKPPERKALVRKAPWKSLYLPPLSG